MRNGILKALKAPRHTPCVRDLSEVRKGNDLILIAKVRRDYDATGRKRYNQITLGHIHQQISSRALGVMISGG